MGTFRNDRPIPVPSTWREALAEIGEALLGAPVDPATLTDELVALLGNAATASESALVGLAEDAGGADTSGLVGPPGGDGGATVALASAIPAAIGALDSIVQSDFGVFVTLPLVLSDLAEQADGLVEDAREGLGLILTNACNDTLSADLNIPSQILGLGAQCGAAANFAAFANDADVLGLTPVESDTLSVRLDAIKAELEDLVDLVDTIVSQTSAVPYGTSLRAKLTAIAEATD